EDGVVLDHWPPAPNADGDAVSGIRVPVDIDKVFAELDLPALGVRVEDDIRGENVFARTAREDVSGDLQIAAVAIAARLSVHGPPPAARRKEMVGSLAIVRLDPSAVRVDADDRVFGAATSDFRVSVVDASPEPQVDAVDERELVGRSV